MILRNPCPSLTRDGVMHHSRRPEALYRLMMRSLCVILIAAAGFLIGFGSVYVKPWSLVIIEQEVDSAEAVRVPGSRYKVRYQVRTRAGLSEPREDVRLHPLGCGRTLIRTPLLVGAREVTFYVTWEEALPRQAYRCRDGSRVFLRADAPRSTILVAVRPFIALPWKRWVAGQGGFERGDAMDQR